MGLIDKIVERLSAVIPPPAPKVVRKVSSFRGLKVGQWLVGDPGDDMWQIVEVDSEKATAQSEVGRITIREDWKDLYKKAGQKGRHLKGYL